MTELLEIRRCKRCREVAGDKTGFGPWCVGSSRSHSPVKLLVRVEGRQETLLEHAEPPAQVSPVPRETATANGWDVEVLRRCFVEGETVQEARAAVTAEHGPRPDEEREMA